MASYLLPEALLLHLYIKTLRQDNPSTQVMFVSIMADPRALMSVLIALINYLDLHGTFIIYLLNVCQEQDSFFCRIFFQIFFQIELFIFACLR